MTGYVIIGGRYETSWELWTYFFRAERLGAGIERTLRDAQSRGASEPHVVCVDVGWGSAIEDDWDLNIDEFEIVEKDSLYRVRSPESYDGDHGDFLFPDGIAISADDGDMLDDPDLIREGYCPRHVAANEPYLEIVVDSRRLRDVFFQLIRSLPVADGFEVRVEPHWTDDDNGQTFLADPSFAGERIIQYLQQHEDDLIRNGFLNLAVYCRREKSTLRLTDHKTLEFFAFSYDAIREFENHLRDADLPSRDPLPSIGSRHGHFHWRPNLSKDRPELIRMLTSDGFVRVD